MKLQVFAVRDGAVETFLPPFFVRHVGEAVRSFTDAVEDKSHQFSKHASDFTLFNVGSWNDDSGLFEPSEPVRIVSGLELLSSK